MKDTDNKRTVPAMPAAMRKIHRPTLKFKMNIEQQEEKAKSESRPGRYSVIDGLAPLGQE